MATIARGGTLMLTAEDRSTIADFEAATREDSPGFSTSSGRALPPELNLLINKVVRAVVQEVPISITTMPKELTTTNAAAILGISRPTLMKYIREGRIQARKVGSHHRLKSREVIELADALKEEQRRAVFDLMDIDED